MRRRLTRDLDEVLDATRELWEEVRGERIFVTGATGFFGCWLLETFLWANERLRLKARVTILTRDPETLRTKAPHLADSDALDVVVGDVRTFGFPRGTFSHVIHAATESSAILNSTRPGVMFDTIVEGTRHCLELAAAAASHKFLLTSSGAVYGSQPADLQRVPEEFRGAPDPLDRNSAYGEGKRAVELLCVLAGGGLEAKIARCFAFAGPYMKLDAHFAIGNFIQDQLNGRPIVVKGDGTARRSYMYASELMVWLWTILFRGAAGRAYNVGSEQDVSIAELAKSVAETLCPRVPVEIMGRAVPGVPAQRYVPSTARARTELGLSCTVSLPETIRRTQAWFQAETRLAVP